MLKLRNRPQKGKGGSSAKIAAIIDVAHDLVLTGQFTTTNFFNWETAPVHPVALSPDLSYTAVADGVINY